MAEQTNPAAGAGTKDGEKKSPGRKKVDRGTVIKTISQGLFGPKEVPVLKIANVEFKGEAIEHVLRGFLNYCEAAADAGRKPDFGEFLTFALEPGLRQVFRYTTADTKKAMENAKLILGEGIFPKRKANAPSGEPLN